ncbi:hypothetical protein ACM1PE_06750 [Achromobacter sp. PD1]|uniref:hypothetical protein n=1 Tax=Achromobacter sp. PD1 TaxID=3399125 RepID=UPI003AF9F03A
MTDHTPAAQSAKQEAVLTDEEILRSAINASDSLNITRVHEMGGPSRTIMDDAGLLELGRAVESVLLSKLRAPVADERERGYAENAAFRIWWDENQACPEHSLTTENAAHAAWQERGRRAALASAPIATTTDRAMLQSVLQDLENSDSVCPRCGNSDSCADMDVAYMIRDHLKGEASAPVAGEAVAHAVISYGRIQRLVVNEESAHEYAEQQRLNAEAAGWDAKAHVRPLVYGDAAPQASEAVRNAVLEEAASVCDSWLMAAPSTELEAMANQTMERMGRNIRALKMLQVNREPQ